MPAESNTLAISKESERTFARGFKAWCDNVAVTVRRRMDLNEYDPLDPATLAAQMGATILDLEKIDGLDVSVVEHLSSVEGDEWSAVTVHINERNFVVLNPRHSLGRRNSDLMHELAHIIREHDSSKVHIYDDYAIRSFDTLQENEANWLASALLLPRPALVRIMRRNEDVDEAIQRFGVTKSLFNYRLNITGVRRQLMRSR